MAVEGDRVHGDLGARYAAIDDHVELVVAAIEAVDVHATLAVTVPQRCQARSLRVIHRGRSIARFAKRAIDLPGG
jgi:trans-aconitate methyltransferase